MSSMTMLNKEILGIYISIGQFLYLMAHWQSKYLHNINLNMPQFIKKRKEKLVMANDMNNRGTAGKSIYVIEMLNYDCSKNLIFNISSHTFLT